MEEDSKRMMGTVQREMSGNRRKKLLNGRELQDIVGIVSLLQQFDEVVALQ